MQRNILSYERPTVEVLGGVNVFFDRVLRQKVDVRRHMDWRARKIKEFIDAHPMEARRNLDDVCKQLDLPMSGRQARRLFKLSIGVGVRLYARNRRLSLAIEHLERANTPIKAVAADLGFQNSRQFSRNFKEVLGLSPQEFRKVWSTRSLGAGLDRSV
jgi:methylphosphotriester-DNA--protein-cysteine methyltransferase